MSYYDWEDEAPARSVGDRRKHAEKIAAKLAAEGEILHPAASRGRDPARSFWGKAWCRHIEGFHDYASRLAPGRSYLKNHQVIDLVITPGRVEARVAGENLYTVRIAIDAIDPERLEAVRRNCAGEIHTLVELLQGQLSENVIASLCDAENGIFPEPEEIRLDCDCPDWADLCKHLAAVLYGIGTRLDDDPALFFTLRGIDPAVFFRGGAAVAGLGEGGAAELNDAEIGDIFGIEL